MGLGVEVAVSSRPQEKGHLSPSIGIVFMWINSITKGERVSALKLQLRKILPELSSQANKISDPEIKKRLYLIKAVTESPKDVKRVCELRGVSPDYFYKWARRLLKRQDLLSLKPKSRKPDRSPNQTPKRVEKRIRILRKLDPSLGPERISDDLKRIYNMICSPSAVYAVLKRLKLVTKQYRDRLTKKHMKRYRRPLPGWLQMDIKYVPYEVDGEQFYQWSCVDHCSSWRLIRIYEDKSLNSLREFLLELEVHCPFPIVQIQTDNDAVFTDKYRIGSNGLPTGLHPLDVWCEQKGIEHKLIAIGQKELNGKVENTHKQDDREFYSQNYPKDLFDLQARAKNHNRKWNELRRTKVLGWRSPNETLEHVCVVWAARFESLRQRGLINTNNLVKIDQQGNAQLLVQKPKPTQLKKSKKQSVVDRYLKWLDADEKKYKSFTLVPAMCQIFSSFVLIFV